MKIEVGGYYAIKAKDPEVVLNSRSGGIFTLVSDIILDTGGVVYGCALDSDFSARHTVATTKEERNLFRGSKYIQSDMGNTFLEVMTDLLAGKTVMFSGTPCQTAGLKSFLDVKGVDTERLILVDVLCHAAPSPLVWQDYLNLIRKQTKKEIVSVDFRNKKMFGWADHKETFELSDGTVKSTFYFTRLFFRHNIVRPSCYNCQYKDKHVSDITIGDCWGIDKINKEFNNDEGTSLVIPNTQKGAELLNEAYVNMYAFSVEPKSVWQIALVKSVDKPKEREEFWKYYSKHSTWSVVKKYARDPLKIRLKRAVRDFIRGGKGKNA